MRPLEHRIMKAEHAIFRQDIHSVLYDIILESWEKIPNDGETLLQLYATHRKNHVDLHSRFIFISSRNRVKNTWNKKTRKEHG
jgi:hypothetical protein